MTAGPKYTTVLLDADQTIWDFLSAENGAVKEILKQNGLPHGDDEAELYNRINLSFWKRLERGEIKRSEIYVGRFAELARHLHTDVSPEKLNEDYFAALPLHSKLLPGAFEFLQALKDGGLQVGLITNGATVTQKARIAKMNIAHFFDGIFISEEMGLTKPQAEYFEAVLHALKVCDKHKVLIVGDSPSADIAGGANADIDTCLYSPGGESCLPVPTYAAKNYDEILHIIFG